MHYGPYTESDIEKISEILKLAKIPYKISFDEDHVKKSFQNYAQRDGLSSHPGFEFDARSIEIDISNNHLHQLPKELEKFAIVPLEIDPPTYQTNFYDRKDMRKFLKAKRLRQAILEIPMIIFMGFVFSIFIYYFFNS